MKPAVSEYKHIEGKTYSLFGQSDYTAEYYSTISDLADRVMATHPDIKNLVDDLQRFSSRRKRLRHVTRHHDNGDPMHHILRLIDPSLGKYTENVEQHLKKLPLRKWWDRRLATSREQYHLYMLEIELTNRVFAEEFRKAHRKIALLPYCLQDFSVSCMSEKAGFDYQCRHCSAKCCVPELTFGMRSVRKKGLPVVGIPLNANRCIRWFGEFFPNSVDLEQLSRLVTAPTLPEL
jgi:hypothetical protein